MPTAAGARALLSAQTPSRARRLPRVAAITPAAARSALGTLPHHRCAPCRPSEPAVAGRGFHTSSSLHAARPDEPPPPPPPPPPSSADSNKDNGAPLPGNGQPAEAPAQSEADPAAADADANANANANAKREKLKSAGYGSARARANRNNRVEEPPALELPRWFELNQISLYERRPIGVAGTLLPRLGEGDREQMLTLMETLLDKAALSDEEVESLKDRLRRFANRQDRDDLILTSLKTRARRIHQGAFWQALLLLYHPLAEPAHVERLRQHHAASIDRRQLWWPLPDSLMSDELKRWLSNLRSDAGPGRGFHLSPLAKRPDSEYPICMELLAAVDSQLAMPPTPSRQDARRPPIVLSMLKGKGPTLAESVVNDIATDLQADVIHLNAHHIARIVGRHVGQNPYSARGALSMLGYAAAEMNGRLAARPSPDADQLGVVAVELPSRLRSFLSPRESTAQGLFDGRWEDMKVNAALEAIVAAVDRERERARLSAAAAAALDKGGSADADANAKLPSARKLIIHLHDYVELSSLYPSIIHKLRAIADRMWRAGRGVVLVGSSSGDMDRSLQWRDQVIELGRDGAHVIPFHADSVKDYSLFEDWDNVLENLFNIKEMLRAVVGDQVPITFITEFMDASGTILSEESHKTIFKLLASHVYDAQWVQRVVSLMGGGRTGSREGYGVLTLNYALKFMLDRNKQWEQINPSVRPPYYSPLHTPRSGSSSSSSFPYSSSSADDPAAFSNLSGAAASKEYNNDEKKLLSGLINAKDIHTTFDQIIVPQETKESLMGLTTLSLVRPEAFSYGVLKTEHISGCLLYGPPGTGKTLLAKAVAKESGANMLEVSAADINDKWVGQSEKNVQALFSLARKLAPCVIFLDEADALLAARRSGPARAAYRETITQFLREWDGLTGSRAFIMVATNRPFDLDEAVLRRLPRKILVDLPLAPEREAILRVVLRDEVLAPDVDLARLAAETELYSGSDLKNLCVSAAMEAVREEVRAKEAWTGEGEYRFPDRRVLTRAHFDKGLREISASISGDMQTLKAIRKFDEQYGDAGRKRRVRKGLGFDVVPDDGKGLTGEARVRQVEAA
ncbi:uncharacterized protein P884DRAFT_218591 [Thermothelomyces heterothallicus CBS 202.75]|uniref:uncharacterized protein n=1 Tax=Thermothelomyces heterothallicus CBS 202.75 TaxID=1149848 RepID=UPI003743E8FA